MSITIIDVVEYQYPGQIQAGNVSFRQPESELLLGDWTVPNVPKPTEEELLAYGALHERDIEINSVKNNCLIPVQNAIDAVAQAKTYSNGVSCASYADSGNASWKAEAMCFIAWRDSVWNYLYNLLATISGNSDPIPSVDEIIAGMPVIVWPA
jgi:hypothetical protein